MPFWGPDQVRGTPFAFLRPYSDVSGHLTNLAAEVYVHMVF